MDLSCSGFPDNIEEWIWTFGDGNTSSAVNPVHLYDDVGVYEVKLVMTDYLDCQDSMIHEVFVKPLSTIMDTITIDTNYFCDNYPQKIELASAGGTGDSVVWYTGNCGQTRVAEGDTVLLDPPTDTLVYYARHEGFCGISDCDSLTAFVHLSAEPPDSVTVNYNNFCQGTHDSLMLVVHGGWGDTVSWYSQNCGGTFLGHGDTLMVPSPDVITSYYGRWENSCSNSNCSELEVTILALPPTAITGPDTLCGFASGIVYETQDNTAIGNTYNWTIGNATPVSATDHPQITLDFGNGPATAQIIVLEVNQLSCENRDTLDITIHSKPAALNIYHD